MPGKHTGTLASEATARKKKNTRYPGGVSRAGVGTDMPLPMPIVGLSLATVAPRADTGK
ncbi:MAG TPA: hypothetical protein VF909_02355 [Roseiflexaceae bacterium]